MDCRSTGFSYSGKAYLRGIDLCPSRHTTMFPEMGTGLALLLEFHDCAAWNWNLFGSFTGGGCAWASTFDGHVCFGGGGAIPEG